MAVLGACTQPTVRTPTATASSTPSPSAIPTEEGRQFPVPEDYECDQDLILEWPVIDGAVPLPARAGARLEITGHGGAIRCGNAYDESSRDFDVYMGDEMIGTFNCYVNHCEGFLDLPAELEPGAYSLSVGPNTDFELEVQ